MTTIHDLVADLRATQPALDRVLGRHMADHEIFLPHVFMADVTRSLCAAGPDAAGRAVINVIADHFERGDADVRNVVVASFLENLEADDPGQRAIVDALPPALAAARARMEDDL